MQNSLSVQVLSSPILAALLHELQHRRQPNFVAWYKEWNYGTFADGTTYIQLGGQHVGHRPTFLVLCYVMLMGSVLEHCQIGVRKHI